MTLHGLLSDLKGPIPKYTEADIKPRLSLTSDVLDYRQCERKYGLYKVRGFAAASPTAEFVGTFAHRSIEQSWRHFKAHAGAPTNAEVAAILEAVRVQMVEDESRKPHSWHAVVQAGMQVMRLVRSLDQEGVFGSIIDCERTLRLVDAEFTIEGVIDTITSADGTTTLWDYKVARDPRRVRDSTTAPIRSKLAAERRLQDYSFQLRVYHHLYAHIFGVERIQCRVLFVGEIEVPKVNRPAGTPVSDIWAAFNATPIPSPAWANYESTARDETQPGLFYSVAVDPASVATAMDEFRKNGARILESRRLDEWHAPPAGRLPDVQTCNDCDFLRSCPTAYRRQ